VRTLLNVIWLVLSGLWLAIGYAIAGVIMCILIVTIPFGLQAFKLAGHSLWPFGRTVVKRPGGGRGLGRGERPLAVAGGLVARAAPSSKCSPALRSRSSGCHSQWPT
jgi:hypothetical protein